MPTDEQAVSLRPLVLGDADVFAGWAADDEFRRRADWDLNRSTHDYQQFHRRLIQCSPAELLRLGVVRCGLLIGYIDLHGSQPQRRELGFVIGERGRWGIGLGHAAAAAGLTHGFRQLALHEVWAQAADTNEPSIRILRSLGMQETRRGDDCTYMGQRTYHRQFAITVEQWLAAPP